MTESTLKAQAEPAVRFEKVTKRYGGFLAVDQVSFDIERASLVTLLGPSGCGKTTTLRLIAGLEQTSGGTIRIGGTDVTSRSAAERDVSMVFQSYALFPHMTVMENACYGLRASGLSKREAMERAAAKLALVGLAGFEHRQPGELSGGQQQRVAVARAIVLEPQVLLFDEPLSNLDAKLRRHVRDEIRSLQQTLSLTVVYVTHDQEEALAVSDRIIVMRGGRIAQDGAPRELYEAPASRFVADFMGDANLLPVRILKHDGERASFEIGTRQMTAAHRGIPPGAASLAVRPQQIGLSPRKVLDNEFEGEIRKAAYLGNHMEYTVTVSELGLDLFVTNPGLALPLHPGSRVAVRFDEDSAVLVSAQDG